ncbi:DNA processing protein [Haloactinopolyspora alba]|uniref:DNA processing protein n=1 Tax=Haloactinopolyspora alba TaxID=648780 RepID=A0A2P8DVF2_9ACTN|nr:DNA-processing protein DprA [Haloactinopolyspora alba]PSL01185.1 DNA processing protein [Haloactinopolyspora alba]
MSAVDTPERTARAALSAVVEPGVTAIMRRVEAQSAARTWAAVRDGDDGLDRNETLRRRADGVDGAALLRHAERLGVRYVCPGEPGWPPQLDVMADTLDAGADAVPPPLGLWVRGEAELGAAVHSAVAVVGSRAATRYGERVSADLGSDLAGAGWTVVSGAAFGVDAAAHRGALALGGTTVAVLACGVDVAYPRGHAALLGRVAESGAVLSELPPGMRPTRSRFIARNRVIAALTRGTVVVEAALRSGALSTATWADRLCREVLAVPGPVTSALSSGCHFLVRDKGATMVTDATDVLDAVGRLGADAAPTRVGERRPLDGLRPTPRDVREAMDAAEPSTVEGLAAATGLPAQIVMRALTELAAAGLVDGDGDGWRLSGGGVGTRVGGRTRGGT